MGTRTSYEPGVFCWVDLATSDADAAKAFYAELFGWEYEDSDMGDGLVYSLAQVDGKRVAGLMGGHDQPPHWNSYIAVESAEDAVAKAKEAGAEIVQDVMDVGGPGKMAFLQDPSGAMVGVWEAGETIGAELVNAHGALSWNSMQTHDVDKAVEFFTSVFGWEVAPVDEDDEQQRVIVRVGESMNGSLAQLPEEMGPEVPPHWTPYFAVDDLDAAIERGEKAGGNKAFGPMEIPVGRLAMLTDPQGAAFALFSGQLAD